MGGLCSIFAFWLYTTAYPCMLNPADENCPFPMSAAHAWQVCYSTPLPSCLLVSPRSLLCFTCTPALSPHRHHTKDARAYTLCRPFFFTITDLCLSIFERTVWLNPARS